MISQMIPAGTIPASLREIHGRFRLPGANQHTAFASAKREHVSRTRKIGRFGRGIDRNLDGARTVLRRDAGGDSLASVDGFTECRPILRRVLRRHQSNVKVLETLLGHRQADQATSIFRHEVDGFGRDCFSSEGEVAFVLAVLVVYNDDHPARADFCQCFWNAGERWLRAHVQPILAGPPRDKVNVITMEDTSWVLSMTSTPITSGNADHARRLAAIRCGTKSVSAHHFETGSPPDGVSASGSHSGASTGPGSDPAASSEGLPCG